MRALGCGRSSMAATPCRRWSRPVSPTRDLPTFSTRRWRLWSGSMRASGKSNPSEVIADGERRRLWGSCPSPSEDLTRLGTFSGDGPRSDKLPHCYRPTSVRFRAATASSARLETMTMSSGNQRFATGFAVFQPLGSIYKSATQRKRSAACKRLRSAPAQSGRTHGL